MAAFDGINKTITLDSGITSLDVSAVYSEWKEWTLLGNNLSYAPALRADGGAPLSSIINQGSYFFLNNGEGWRIRPPEENITVYLTGNLAVEDPELPAFAPTIGNFTTAILGLQAVTQGITPIMGEQLEFVSFGGEVTVDSIFGTAGTGYTSNGDPIGTVANPSSNITDAAAIATNRGFDVLRVKGVYVFSATDAVNGFIIQGLSASKTTLVIPEAADITNCVFREVTLSGYLDGGNDASSCVIGSITYVDGTLLDCFLTSGVIVLRGTQASFLRCASAVASSDPNLIPTIDLGGTGTALVIRDYIGGLRLINHTSGDDNVSVDMSSGEVVLDSTISSGTYTLRGIAELTDNSTGTTYVRDFMAHNSDAANLKQLIELNRPHHTGTGKMIYWDPFGGDDTRRGDHIGRAVKTFAQAHNLALDNGHDIIVAVSGNPAGVTTTNENITISKNYLFLRGPGRAFVMHSTNDALDTVNITGNGVEVSGMVVTNEVNSTKNTIAASGSFPYLHNVYSTGSAKGFLITNSNYANIVGCQLSHNVGYGLRIEGNAIHTNIDMCHLGRNDGTGIEIGTVGGHDVVIGRTEIYGNGGWGVDIGAAAENVMIRSDVIVEDNVLGPVRDLGTNSADFTGWVQRGRESQVTPQDGLDIATAVWNHTQ